MFYFSDDLFACFWIYAMIVLVYLSFLVKLSSIDYQKDSSPSNSVGKGNVRSISMTDKGKV